MWLAGGVDSGSHSSGPSTALPTSPHVITQVVESDLPVRNAGLLAQSARVQSAPVVDPLESDEEDELDALSRNVTGVPAVGHADLQGPTQMDSDDEPMAPVVVPVFGPVGTDDEDEGMFPMAEVCETPTLAVHGRCAVLASPAVALAAHHDDIPAIVRSTVPTFQDVLFPEGMAQGFPAPTDPIPSTIPASSGAVRRIELISNSQDVRSTVPVMDLTMLGVF